MRYFFYMGKAGDKKTALPTSVRITPTCKELWDTLADRMGVSNAAYLEVLIREKAKAEGVEIKQD